MLFFFGLLRDASICAEGQQKQHEQERSLQPARTKIYGPAFMKFQSLLLQCIRSTE